MYYIYNLRIKKRYRLRGLEVYITDKIDTMDTSWVPLGRAKSINEYDHFDLGDKLEKILAGIKEFGHKLKSRDLMDLLKERFEYG